MVRKTSSTKKSKEVAEVKEVEQVLEVKEVEQVPEVKEVVESKEEEQRDEVVSASVEAVESDVVHMDEDTSKVVTGDMLLSDKNETDRLFAEFLKTCAPADKKAFKECQKAFMKQLKSRGHNLSKYIKKQPSSKKSSGVKKSGGLTKPCLLSDEFCDVFGLERGSLLTRPEAGQYVNKYIDTHGLRLSKDEATSEDLKGAGLNFRIDDTLRRIFRCDESKDRSTILQIQHLIKQHFIKPELMVSSA